MECERNYLIVGLGNPGAAYAKTRHNVGFEVVKGFAQKHRVSFKHDPHLIGDVAHFTLHGKEIFLLLPVTYMNSSGDAVKRCMKQFEVPIEHLMVVCDDVALPLGTM